MNRLTTNELLDVLTGYLKAGEPFYHTRWNDGELYSAFGLRDESQANCDGHHYFTDMNEAMGKTLYEVCEASGPDKHIYVGSWWQDDPTQEAAAALKRFVETWHGEDGAKFVDKVRWAVSDMLPQTKDDDGDKLIELLKALAETNRVQLVGNRNIRESMDCLKAGFSTVPDKDAWRYGDKLKRLLREPAGDGNVFVWCAGIPAKVWSWQLWNEFPQSSHLDLGHVFDGVFDNFSRDWMRQHELIPWRFLQDKLIPYVKGAK